jgi:hypothetical protein
MSRARAPVASRTALPVPTISSRSREELAVKSGPGAYVSTHPPVTEPNRRLEETLSFCAD